MSSLQTAPELQRPRGQATPDLIFEALHRYQHTMALKGAIDLELFTHIARGAATAREIAASCEASERGVRILCDFLTITGFLLKTDSSYRLTAESALFLDKQSPAYVGSISAFLAHPLHLNLFSNIAELVRQGGPLDHTGLMHPKNGIWVVFAKAMEPILRTVARIAAPIIAEPGRHIKVLDVAAGSGIFGIEVALHNPAAHIVAVDWGEVLEVAVRNAGHAGIEDRFQTVPGDVFQVNLGTGYDLVIISNFLHAFDAGKNVQLLKRVRSAINPGGRLAVVDLVPHEDRISPPIPAAFAMNMLGGSQSGDAYTFRELEEMLRAGGFGRGLRQQLEPTPMTLILSPR